MFRVLCIPGIMLAKIHDLAAGNNFFYQQFTQLATEFGYSGSFFLPSATLSFKPFLQVLETALRKENQS